MNKLYGLFYTPADPKSRTTFVSASMCFNKLTRTIPHVRTWHIANDPNDKNLIRYGEDGLNNKFSVREIPFVC